MQNDHSEADKTFDACDVHLAFTIAEACARAGIGRTSIYKAIKTGELRAIKCGARTLILPVDLRRWLEGLPALQP